jgi:hypothetical protein
MEGFIIMAAVLIIRNKIHDRFVIYERLLTGCEPRLDNCSNITIYTNVDTFSACVSLKRTLAWLYPGGINHNYPICLSD